MTTVRTAAEEVPVFMPGDVVSDAYEIRAVLGSGGMGEVYEARDRALNRRVALKVMRPGINPDYLLREGRALAAIVHPGVVTVHTMGNHKGIAFLVLERVHGLSLDKMIDDRRKRGERFGVTEAMDLIVSVADTLNVVHRAGLAHRDVKPSNVMLAPGGRVVLMDFGLVLPHADRPGHRSVAGSLDYMAPEALLGEVAEGAAHLLDIYGLGILAYELLTGILPFDAGIQASDIYRAKTRALPLLTSYRSDVPKPLATIISQMLSPEPADRPQSAEAALWQLRALRSRLGTGGSTKPLTVLIVDDDADMRDALTLYVRTAAPEAEIEKASDGRQAVRAFRRHMPELLLLDLDLPDINGIEVCMLLRGMKLGESCVVVSVSARATRADVELLHQLGVRSLDKGPGLMSDLVQLVQRMRPQQ